MISKHLEKIFRSPEMYYDRKKFTRLDKNERIKPFSKKTLEELKKFIFSDMLQTYPSNKKKLSHLISIKEKINKEYINIIPGSDSGIKYIFEVFTNKSKREMASIFPTYGMINVYAKIYKYKFQFL